MAFLYLFNERSWVFYTKEFDTDDDNNYKFKRRKIYI